MMRPAATAAGVGTFAFRDSHLTPPIDRGPRARLWPNQGTLHSDAANQQSYATCAVSVKPRARAWPALDTRAIVIEWNETA